MGIEERSTGMSATILLYIRQRYSSPLFPLLAAFLMLYARGFAWSAGDAAMGLFYTLLLLFWFRLYDDLASRAADAGKPGRAYTEPGSYDRLRRVLLPLGLALAACTFLADTGAGIILAAWLLLQGPAYRLLYHRRGWGHLLPLLKYPVLALLLAIFGADSASLAARELPAYLALLPAFILFESLDDPSYHQGKGARGLLLLAAHLLLVPAMSPGFRPVAFAGMALAAIPVYQHGRIPGARYIVMLYFLLLRLATIYAIQFP